MNSTFKKRFFHAAGCRLLILIGLITSQPIWAQIADSSASFSIKDCIEYAAQKNSKLKISRYDEEIAQQQVRQIRGRGLPQANINGTFEDRLKVPLLVIPGAGSLLGGDTTGTGSGSNNGNNADGKGIPLGYQFNTTLTGEVTQMIFDPSFWVGLKAAKYSGELYLQNTQQASEQVAYSVADAYYQVIVAQKQLQLLHSNLTNTQATLSSTELQFKNGVAKQVDVNRLRVNASNLESQIRQAELTLLQSLNSLKFQMGMPLNQQITLSDTTLTFNESDALSSDAPENYIENRIDYRILQTNLALQELDRRNISTGYFPTLTAFANYGYTGQGPNLGLFKTAGNGWVDYTTASIGLRLRIPIFDGLQRSAQVQQSRIKARQIEENITLTRQNINLEVANALTQYRNTVQRIESEQKNVELAQEVYQVTQLEFREGVGTSTDVVNAETSLRQAQNTYITTLLDLYRARLNLERSKGNLLTYLNSAK
ncbi:TolC family protein [Xanthocytophaga agilis]|uniref:TolC family protein n=1 Tax=Xanthocytophaga agilis TaxID=3048010 RepID=A0AAE3QZB1_9BACT|nr:TolC family protein [Xanthocytophaga agilis]MDJ1500225.1 TolC family protein [Xanthocytophaga agilis]